MRHAGLAALIILIAVSSCKRDDHNTNDGDLDRITSWEAPEIEENRPEGLERRELSVITDKDKMAIPDDTVVIEEEVPQEPQDDLVKEAQKVGGNGDLKITLLWDFQGDIDIHVVQPSGREINYRQKKDSRTGGYLDVDNTKGGRGSAENVFWRKPPKGTYKVSLEYYPMSQYSGSGTCNVVVMRKGEEPKTYKVRMNQPGDRAFVTTVTVD